MSNNKKNIIKIADIDRDFPCDHIFYNTDDTDTKNFLSLLGETGGYRCEYHTPMKIESMRMPYLARATFDVWREYEIKDKIVLVRLETRSYIISTFPYGTKGRTNDIFRDNEEYILNTLVDYALSLSYEGKDGQALKYNKDEMNSFIDMKNMVPPADYFHAAPDEFNKLFTIVTDEEDGIKAINITKHPERVEYISFVTPGYAENGF